ncbi:TIGR02186 family protein [Escherichia coli]
MERWVYRLSLERPLWYGLLSLALAVAAGWGASAGFRALRRG